MWLLLIFLGVGCTSPTRASRIDVEMKNQTRQELSESTVWFGEYHFRAGILPPGIFKVYMYFPDEITRMARVTWKDAGNQKHEVEVDLSGLYKLGMSGRLEIAITDKGVVAQMKPLPTPSR